MEASDRPIRTTTHAPCLGTDGTGGAHAGLIEDALRGDSQAVSELVRRHWPDAQRAAFLITRDEHLAEDVAQESIVAMIENLGSIDKRRLLRPWLHQIVVRRSIDALRSGKSRASREAGAEAPKPEVPVGISDPDLTDALWTLPDIERTVVVLRHVFDYPASEISWIVGEPASTVRTRLQRGLDRMRQLLDSKGERQ